MKKYLLNLGLAMFLFGSTPLIAMNSSKTSYFKRGLAVCATLGTGALTCAHYGLAFGPTWSDAFERKVAEHEFWANVDIINQPSAEAQKFIRDNLAKQGMENPEIVTIRRYSHHTDKEYEKDDLMLKSPMTYNNRIGVPSYLKEKLHYSSALEDTLEKCKESELSVQTKKELASHNYIYRHESNHIRNQDERNAVRSLILLPLLTECFYYLSKKPFSASKRWVRNLLALPIGFAKNYVNWMLFKAYSRYVEQRADDEVITDDDPNILQAAIDFMYEAQEYEENEMNPDLKTASIEERQAFRQQLLKRPFYRNFRTHPWPILRAQRFEQRLEAIKNNTK